MAGAERWPLVLMVALFAVLVTVAVAGCASPPDGTRVCPECVVTITAPAWGDVGNVHPGG